VVWYHVGGDTTDDAADAADEAVGGIGNGSGIQNRTRKGVDGGDAGGEVTTDVSGLATGLEHELAGAGTFDDERAIGESRFESQANVVLGTSFAKGGIGVVRARFFITVEDEGPCDGGPHFFQRFQRSHGDDEAALHINAAGAGGGFAIGIKR
jgi:hypothetical protein